MRECVFIIGTRAQLVKVAPVLKLASKAVLKHVVWFTGQHLESIDDLVQDFGIQSEIVRRKNQAERSSMLRLVTWLPGTLLDCFRYVSHVRERAQSAPLIVVHGDTLSTFIGALAGRLAGGRIVHLESGLSSGHITDPFPEEMLRRLTFRLTDLALCPNEEASDRMRKVGDCEVVNTGENTLLDCVRDALGSVPVAGVDAGYFVASIHRYQNIFNRTTLQTIVDGIIELSAIGRVHFILHPPTELRLVKYGLLGRLDAAPDVVLQARMPYTQFLALVAGARGVISDGGSNQEELSYLGVPTVLFRKRSERPDGIGRNVIFFDPCISSLADFVSSGHLDALRRPARLDADAQPSQASLEALTRWAA